MAAPMTLTASFLDVIFTRDVALLRQAADACDLVGRTAWADAIRESIEMIGDESSGDSAAFG